VSQREKKTLETISALLEGVDWEFDDEGNIISDLDVQEANERILSEVQEQHKLDMELAQVGIAINIINHEFDHVNHPNSLIIFQLKRALI